MHKCQSIQNKTGMAAAGAFPKAGSDFVRRQSLFNHLSGGDYQKAGAGGEIAAVNHMNMAQFFRSQAAVLMGAGEGASQVDVDDIVSLFHPWKKVVPVFVHVDGGRFGKQFFLIVDVVDLIGRDVHIILVFLSVQEDVERKILNVIALFQFQIQVAGAVRT